MGRRVIERLPVRFIWNVSRGQIIVSNPENEEQGRRAVKC